MNYFLDIWIKKTATDRNPAAIALTFCEADVYPSYTKWMKRIGFGDESVATRKIQFDEFNKRERMKYRLCTTNYYFWSEVLEDERRFTSDPLWFEKLAILEKQFPQFRKKSGQMSLPMAQAGNEVMP